MDLPIWNEITHINGLQNYNYFDIIGVFRLQVMAGIGIRMGFLHKFSVRLHLFKLTYSFLRLTPQVQPICLG